MAKDAAKKDAQPGMAKFVPILIPTTKTIAITAKPASKPEPIIIRRRT